MNHDHDKEQPMITTIVSARTLRAVATHMHGNREALRGVAVLTVPHTDTSDELTVLAATDEYGVAFGSSGRALTAEDREAAEMVGFVPAELVTFATKQIGGADKIKHPRVSVTFDGSACTVEVGGATQTADVYSHEWCHPQWKKLWPETITVARPDDHPHVGLNSKWLERIGKAARLIDSSAPVRVMGGDPSKAAGPWAFRIDPTTAARDESTRSGTLDLLLMQIRLETP